MLPLVIRPVMKQCSTGTGTGDECRITTATCAWRLSTASRCRGVGNLYAVGDAAGTGHWCGHRVRFPGVVLASCLMTAKLTEQHLTRVGLGRGGVSWTSLDRGDERRVDRRLLRRQEKRLRALNAEALLTIWRRRR